jgi:hypothetical protein
MKRTTKNHNTVVLRLMGVREASVRIRVVTDTFRILHRVLVHDPDLWCDGCCGFLQMKKAFSFEVLAEGSTDVPGGRAEPK